MRHSFYEKTARQRLAGLLDPGSFTEFLPPAARVLSPHLPLLDLPVAFNDGIIVGSGRLEDRTVLVAAQEGGFMGGALGEVHGAKLTGLLERAREEKPAGVLILADSGGVRLHEANAGLIAASEIIRAMLAVRAAGIPVVTLIGGACGCFGAMGIVARCGDVVIMSEEGRLGMSGPEVIETSAGVEEFDSRDRALVWRTVGGKHRYLLAEANVLVDDDIGAFRRAAVDALARPVSFDLAAVEAEHVRLERRLAKFGACADAPEIWRGMGIARPEELSLMDTAEFLAMANGAAP
jgi:malonate decarboxylase beta subunit